MRVKVLKVWPDTKQTKKGTIWGAQCTWEGHEDVRVSFFFQPQVGEYEVPQVEPRQYEGKEYYSVRKGQPVTAPETSQPASNPEPARQTVRGYPACAYEALETLIGKRAQEYEADESKLKAAAFGCMWITMSKDPVAMAEMEKEGARGGASSSGDELPPDSELPDDNVPY